MKIKEIFSASLYREGLKKIKTAGIASAIVTLALNALLPIIAIIDTNTTRPNQIHTVSQVPNELFAPFGLLMMVLAPILVYTMFSFLNERNKCDFWHAVPQKRINVYLSLTAAVWTWVLGILFAGALLNTVLWLLAKYYTVSFSTVMVTTAVYFFAAVMLASFMTLAMTLTGTTVSNLLIMALLMLFVRVIGGIFIMCVEDVTPILDISYSWMRIFKWDFCLPLALLSGVFDGEATVFRDVPLLLYSAGVVLVALVAGGWFYHRRKSETATKSAPSPLMQHIYRCAVSLPLIFLTGALFVTDVSDSATVTILAILSVLVWVIFELMTTKCLKNVVKSLPVLVVPVLVTLLLCGGVFLTREVVFGTLPEAEEIQGVCLGSSRGYKSYEDIMVENVFVADEELKTLVAQALDSSVEQYHTHQVYFQNCRVLIKLSSGRVISRYLYVDNATEEALRESFYRAEAFSKAALSLPASDQIEDISFSDFSTEHHAKRIWTSFVYEYEQLTDEQKRYIKEYYENTHFGYYKSAEGVIPLATEEGEKPGQMGPSYDHVGNVIVSGYIGKNAFESSYPILCEYMPQTAGIYLEEMAKLENGLSEGVENTLNLIRDTYQEALANDKHMYGAISFRVVWGNLDMAYVQQDINVEKLGNESLAGELLDILCSLKDATDYQCRKDNTIVLCTLYVEGVYNTVRGAEGDEAVYKEEATMMYYHLEFPLSLSAEEVSAILALYDDKTAE